MVRSLRWATVGVAAIWLPLILVWGDVIHHLTFDDAFYYFAIGRNIAEGNGSSFDGLHTTNGYHPLWMLVTTGVYSVGLDGVAAIRALLVIQLVSWLGTLLLLADLVATAVAGWPAFTGRADRVAAGRRGVVLLAGMWFVIAANPYVFKLFVNGMETGVAALAGAGLLWVSAREGGDPLRRPVTATALASVAFLARTDAVLLVGALLVWSALRRGRIDRVVLAAGGAFSAVVLLYLGSNLVLVGEPMQISGAIKRIDPDTARLVTASLCVAAAVAVLVAGRRAGVPNPASKLPRFRALVGATAWWPAGCLVLLAYEWGFTVEVYLWHYAPQALWGILALLVAAADIYEGATIERADDHPAARRRSLGVGAILAAPFVLGGLWQIDGFLDAETSSLQRGDRRAAEWIAANLPDDAVVGSWDAGVIGYFAERTVVNLDGLVNSFEFREARSAGTDATRAFLLDTGIGFVVNHGDRVEGDAPTLRDGIDPYLGEGTGARMELIHREEYVFAGAAGGRTGRRPYGTFVYSLGEDGAGP